MNKKIIFIIITIIFLSILFPGCSENNDIIKRNIISKNQPPSAKILGPEKAFFGENIKLSAIESYDSDGEIVNYKWKLDEDTIKTGKEIVHKFDIEDNYNIDYPLIFTIHLLIEDDMGYISVITHQIKLYPKKYPFYLYPQSLKSDTAGPEKDTIRATGLLNINSPEILVYSLSEPITIDNCKWNLTLYINKPSFALINRVDLLIIDNHGNNIDSVSKNIGFNLLKKELKIILEGNINDDFELKTLEIKIYGLSLKKEIDILYGSEKASIIIFDFELD